MIYHGGQQWTVQQLVSSIWHINYITLQVLQEEMCFAEKYHEYIYLGLNRSVKAFHVLKWV